MGRKKKEEHEKEPNLERWLVSYADFITLLFAVFVTLYSMSQVDKEKVEQVKGSIQQAFGINSVVSGPSFINTLNSNGITPIPGIPREQTLTLTPGNGEPGRAEIREFEDIKATVQSFLQEADAQDTVKFVINSRGLVISLKDAGFFDSGSAEVRPKSFPILDSIAAAIANYTNAIRIEGHTDNRPISSSAFPSNWELSTARATSIVRYLVETQSFAPVRLSAVGYGEYRPIADNGNSEGRQMNRRVDIVMLSLEAEQGEPIKGLRLEE